MLNYLHVSWADVSSFLDHVEDYFELLGERPTGVYGIPRGGLVLAVMISHRLNIPLLLAPCSHALVVDDICDTGESLSHYVLNTSESSDSRIWTTTMYCKPNSAKIEPIIVYDKIDSDKWVVFPWETTGSSKT